MDIEELIYFLKNNLKVELEVENEEYGYFDPCIRKKLRIGLYLQDEDFNRIELCEDSMILK